MFLEESVVAFKVPTCGICSTLQGRLHVQRSQSTQSKLPWLLLLFVCFYFVVVVSLFCLFGFERGRHDIKWKGVRKNLKVKRGE